MQDPTLIYQSHLHRLHRLAYRVRQFSIRGDGGDFEGWRVARLMREAITPLQATRARQRFIHWRHAGKKFPLKRMRRLRVSYG